MKIKELCRENTVLNAFVAQLRDKKIQKDRMRFRRNLERVGEVLAYEISKTLDYSVTEVETPLGIASVPLPSDKMVLITVLRAGLPLHNGILNFFDDVQNAFIGIRRKVDKRGDVQVEAMYCPTPSLEGKVLVLSDVMLATGESLEKVYGKLCADNGCPRAVHFVCAIASRNAVDYLKKNFPGKNFTLWAAAIDEELTSRAYIVPGLGDAGDLAYGDKK